MASQIAKIVNEMNSGELKATMKESPRKCTNPFLSDEENDELNLWHNQEHEHSTNEDTFTTSLEDEKFKKVKEFYIDKIACYEESGLHDVKDICIDNGQSQDKKNETDKKHHEPSCNPDTGTDTDTDTDTVNGDKNDDKSEDRYKNTEKPDAEFPIAKLEDMIGENLDTDISGQSLSLVKDLKEDAPNELENVCEDESGPLNCVPDDLKPSVESNIVQITENCGPEKPESIHEDSKDTESAPNEVMGSDSVTVANQLERGGGESSFSMAGPVSGLIVNSGRVASCGSISYRSDGSNTSVRSFAFPILQTEWNSSPVRMVKVDHRQSRKRRGWRETLACCKF